VRNDRFEWDDGKARSNARKHGITFELAAAAFDDPMFIDVDEPDPDEIRTNRICLHNQTLVVVTFTERGNRIRIKSARTAGRHEQATYHSQRA
jgi:uncharacterized protein